MNSDDIHGLCFAASYQHAVRTMQTDWGWRQVGTWRGMPVFRDEEGRHIAPVSGPERLSAFPQNWVLYLGHRWWNSGSGVADRIQYLKARGVKVFGG